MMNREPPSDEDRAQFRKFINEMISARLEMFEENAPKFAEALGTFRAALQKNGFSPEESMQIILKVAELPGMGGRPFFGGGGRGGKHWRHLHAQHEDNDEEGGEGHEGHGQPGGAGSSTSSSSSS
jgi:hypothetical protein